ncbi:MAG: beta-lactamase regulating signal transducer with metallopeptidase domain [Glaciecola sp.]|jgi:beta-lactamase regulating signal transducer with metallopeptidase domain
MGDLQHTLVAWLLTYGLHSTALISLVWLGIRYLPKESNLAQERLWKCALLGPILTASLQVGFAYEPLGGQLFLPESDIQAEGRDLLRAESPAFVGVLDSDKAAQPTRTSPSNLAALSIREGHSRREANTASHDNIRAQRDTPGMGSNNHVVTGSLDSSTLALVSDQPATAQLNRSNTDLSFTPAVSSTSNSWPFWRQVLLSIWAIGGLIGLLCLTLAWRRIVDYVTRRHELNEGPLFDCLQDISAKAGLSRAPRLLVSKKLGSPATLGVLRPQICVPERAVFGLSPDQQAAMLGHELGHVVRRDPQWFFLYRLVERVLFFQPLNRVARREIQELAEYQCDDWAVKHTGDGIGLARCLTEVASWMVAERPMVALLPMAGRGSQLGHRVRRLLDDESREACARRNAWGLPLALGVFATGAMALPAVAPQKAPLLAVQPRLAAPDLGPPSVMSPVANEIESPKATSPQFTPMATTSAYPQLANLVEELGVRLNALQQQIEALQETAEANAALAETEDDLLRLRIKLLALRKKQLRMTALLQGSAQNKNTTTQESKTTLPGQE